MRHKFKPPAEITTWATVNDNEFDNVIVGIDYQPAEWDTNTAEGVDICYVTYEGRDLYDFMSPTELRDLEDRMLDEVQTMGAEDAADYADWRYQCWKDDRLTGDA